MGTPLHEVSSIETPEQIEVHLPLAGIGSRALAYGIDLCWQVVPIIAAIVALTTLFPEHGSFVEKDDDGQPSINLAFQALLSLGVFLVNFGYFALFETLWQGQTPGKRSVGLRVIKEGGYPLDGRSALLRNFLRVVDFLPASYVLGMGLIFVGRQGKRAGDYAAGTLVIRDTAVHSEAPVQAHLHRGPLTREEHGLLDSFLDRRALLTDDARARVAGALAKQLAETLGRPLPEAPEAFLVDLGRALKAAQSDAHERR